MPRSTNRSGPEETPRFLNRHQVANLFNRSIGSVDRKLATEQLQPDAYLGKNPLFLEKRMKEYKELFRDEETPEPGDAA